VSSSNTATPTEFTFSHSRRPPLYREFAPFTQALDPHRFGQYVEPLLGLGAAGGDRRDLQRQLPPLGQLLQPGAAGGPALGAQVDAADREQVERDERRRHRRDQAPGLGGSRHEAALERVEAEPTVLEDHQLAVDDCTVGQLARCGRGDVGKPVGEVFSLPRPDPSLGSSADDDRAASRPT
jgi:hypothetical protein